MDLTPGIVDAVTKKLVEDEVEKMQKKLIPKIRASIQKYFDSPEFKLKVAENIKSSVEDDLDRDLLEYLTESEKMNLYKNAVRFALGKIGK